MFIGRIEKTITDEVTETVMQWEDDPASAKDRKTNTVINNGMGEKSYNIEACYSAFGNVIYNTDKDGFKYVNKIDRFGNNKYSYKYINNNQVLLTSFSYDAMGKYLEEQNITSTLGISKKVSYQYDNKARGHRY